MSAGLYTMADIARYFRCQRHDVARMIEVDGLPVVQLPGPSETVRKITLHGLHKWLKKKHVGDGAFMSVEELQAEIAAANAGAVTRCDPGLTQLRACVELVFEAVKSEMGRRAA